MKRMKKKYTVRSIALIRQRMEQSEKEGDP